MLANIWTLVMTFKVGKPGERAEILATGFFFLTISLSLLCDSPVFTLNVIEFSALFHIMVLRLICCEIARENCPTELFCFVTPLFFINCLGVTNELVHFAVIILYCLYCVWLWFSETRKICTALKMDNAFSKPPANNNPFLIL